MGDKPNEFILSWRWIATGLLSVVGVLFATAVGIAGAYIKGRSDNWDSTTKIASQNQSAISELSNEVKSGFQSSDEHKRRIENSLGELTIEVKKLSENINKSRCYSDRCDEFDQRLRKGGL